MNTSVHGEINCTMNVLACTDRFNEHEHTTYPDIMQSRLIQMQFSSFLFVLRFLFLSFRRFFHRGLQPIKYFFSFLYFFRSFLCSENNSSFFDIPALYFTILHTTFMNISRVLYFTTFSFILQTRIQYFSAPALWNIFTAYARIVEIKTFSSRTFNSISTFIDPEKSCFFFIPSAQEKILNRIHNLRQRSSCDRHV